jgi:hypothetical protein
MNSPLVFRALNWRDPITGTAEEPHFVTLDAIAKTNENGTASVAAEYICNRLAVLVGLPVPPGALIHAAGSPIAFVSLRFGSLSELPAPVIPSEFVAVHPHLAAGIALFDLLVLNQDRNSGNIAFLKGKQPPVMFDHGRSLCAADRFASMASSQNATPARHCLQSLIQNANDLESWLERFARLDFQIVREYVEDLVGPKVLTKAESAELLGFLRIRLDQLSSLAQQWLPTVEWGLV